MVRVRSFWDGVTASVAYQTVTPCPIWAGVLGMERTIAGWPRPSPSARVLAPAITDSTS